MEEGSPITAANAGCLEFSRNLNAGEQSCQLANLKQLAEDTFVVVDRCARQERLINDGRMVIGQCMLNREVCILPTRFMPPTPQSIDKNAPPL